MSKYLPKFPRKNGEFNIQLKNAVKHINDNSVRLRIDPDKLSELNDLYDNPTTGWKYIYPLAKNDLTATKPLRQRRDILRRDSEKLLLLIYGDIPKSILTVEDRIDRKSVV